MIIGIEQDKPKACTDEHFPGVYNEPLNKTWCICGEVTWEGDRGSWHSRALYDSPRQGAKVLGYDVYYLPPHICDGECR